MRPTDPRLVRRLAPARRPLVTQEDFEDHDPATIQHIIRSSLDRRR